MFCVCSSAGCQARCGEKNNLHKLSFYTIVFCVTPLFCKFQVALMCLLVK